VALLAYICLFTFRVLGSIVILGKACDLIEDHKQKQQQKKKQSMEEHQTGTGGPKHHKDSSASNKTETVPSTNRGQREEAGAPPLSSHRKTVEVVTEPKRSAAVATSEESDESSELFKLPDRNSERLFLFQNSCDDKADVLLTNMNVALLDSPDYERSREISPGPEASSEGDISDRDTLPAPQGPQNSFRLKNSSSPVKSSSRPVSQQEVLSGDSPDKHLLSPKHDQGNGISVNNAVEPEKACRKVCDTLFPLEAGLSPSSKAKSLSSPDLIRSEADFEEWDKDDDEAMEEEEDRLCFSVDGVASLENVRKRGVHAHRP